MSRYEHAIIDYENEKKAFTEMLRQKDQDIAFIKSKYEEINTQWHQENLDKQKLEVIIDQQYREAMELDTLRRKAEDERNQFRSKNALLRTEIEELIKENKKLAQEKENTSNRLSSLRQVNKQQIKKIESLQISQNETMMNMTMTNERQIEDIEAKLNFTVIKFEEQNKRFQQCGQELASAYDTIEALEATVEKLKRDKKVMQAEINELRGISNPMMGDRNLSQEDGIMVENSQVLSEVNAQLALGKKVDQSTGGQMMDNFSHRTGCTKMSSDFEMSMNHDPNVSMLHLLKKQNDLQQMKIKQLEQEKQMIDADALIKQIAH